MESKELIDLNKLLRYGVKAHYRDRSKTISSTPVWRDCIVIGRASRLNGNTLSGIMSEPIWEIIDEYGIPKEIYAFKDVRFINSEQTT